MMGVHAACGRTLEPRDGSPDAERVVVLKYGLWQRRFGGNPDVVGQWLTLNGAAYRVVGVLSREFLIVGTDAELFVPFNLLTDRLRNDRETNLLRTIGLLQPGVSVAQASAELASIEKRLRELYPNSNGKHTDPHLQLFRDEVTGGYRQGIWILMGAVSLVLVIACSNLANLLLTRAASRRREVAVRSALGATRSVLIRQFLGENLMLAVPGGWAGIALARLLVSVLIRLAPSGLPRMEEVALDWPVVVYAVLLTLGSAFLFGLAPALSAARVEIVEALKSRGGPSVRSGRIRTAIVGVQIAFSTVLLVWAALFLRTFQKMQAIDPGFVADHLAVARVSLPQPAYSSAGAIRRFYENLGVRIAREPEVQSFALVSYLPLSAANNRYEFQIYGRKSASPLDVPAAQTRWVSPHYFGTMRIPIREGREFREEENETAAGTAIVDEPLARQFWPGRSPVGTHLRMDGRDFEVVGLCGGVKHAALDEVATGTLYLPFPQVTPSALPFFANGFEIVVRTAVPPRNTADAVRRDIRAVDANVPVSSSRSMEEALALAVEPRRFNLWLVALFATSALLLAGMGLYSVMSYSVHLRSSEIGLRMALGGDAASVTRMIVGEALRIVAAGIGAGAAAAIVSTRLIASLLFETTGHEPAVFGAVVALFVVAGMAAAWAPARRAARLDPLNALRLE